MNIETEIKNHSYKLEQTEKTLKGLQKELSAIRTKYNLSKKKLFSQLKFFSSLTIEEIRINEEKVEQKQSQMDIQLNKIKELYDKFSILEETYKAKEETFNNTNEDYEKQESELEELENKLEENEDEIQESKPVNKFRKKKQ